MSISLSDLFPRRRGRAASSVLQAHPRDRQHGKARAAARLSKIEPETFEPRILRSGMHSAVPTGVDRAVRCRQVLRRRAAPLDARASVRFDFAPALLGGPALRRFRRAFLSRFDT